MKAVPASEQMGIENGDSGLFLMAPNLFNN